MNVLGEPVDFPDRPVQAQERWSIHRAAPSLEEQSTELQMFETGIKVIDLLEPYLPRRQDRAVRRRRRRQDGHHPGADPQRRDEARRRVGVRRRRRAHPRGQRPLAGVPGERRHQHGGPDEVARRAGLRPDDRAARRAPARGAQRPDRRRVLPRRREQGRAALHRQHLPLHAGGLRSVGAARPHAVARSATSRRC